MVVHSYFPRDSRVRRAAEALVGAGHEVDVVCLRGRDEPSAEVLSGISIQRLPVHRRRGGTMARYAGEYGLFAILAAIEMGRRASRRRYDVVYAHNMPDVLVFSGVVPRLLGAKVVLDMHDPMPELLSTDPGMARWKWILPVLNLEERASCRFAHYVITVNDAMKERLVRRRLPPNKVGVVMNLPHPDVVRRLVAARSGREADRVAVEGERKRAFVMVYAGTISERHRLDIAIEAVDRLRTEMPDLHLAVAGEGPAVPMLKRHAHARGLEERVRFLGQLRNEEIPSLLAASDIAIVCHDDGPFWRLCFPLKIVEALTAGLPVIASRTETIEHYLDDSILFYFRPGDVDGFVEQIRKVRANPDVVRAKLEAADARLTELTWDREKGKLVAALAALTGESRPDA